MSYCHQETVLVLLFLRFLLVLSGEELTFFPVAVMGVYFEFVLDAGLVIEVVLLLMSRANTEPRPFLLPALPCREVGGAWKAGRGEVTPNDQEDIPDHTT